MFLEQPLIILFDISKACKVLTQLKFMSEMHTKVAYDSDCSVHLFTIWTAQLLPQVVPTWLM